MHIISLPIKGRDGERVKIVNILYVAADRRNQ